MTWTKQKSTWPYVHKNTGMYLGAHKTGACNSQESHRRPYTCSPPVQAAACAWPWPPRGEAAPAAEKGRESLTPSSGSGSREKQENHHRLLLSDALHFLAKEASLRHSAITGAQLWALLGPGVTTIAGLNTFLLPPVPKFICTLMNTSSAV